MFAVEVAMASFSLLRDGNIIRLVLAVLVLILPSCASLAIDASPQLAVIKGDSTYRSPPDLSRDLFARSDSSSCYSDDYVACGSAVPDNMCCESGTTCMILASNTTIVCCPEGESCNRIHPITCSISQQDTDQHPESTVQTIALNKSMTNCGAGCCPFGYLCNDDDLCELDSNQDHYGYLLSDSTTELSSTATSTSTSALTSTSNLASDATTGTDTVPTLLASTGVASAAAETTSSGIEASTQDTASSPTGLIAACSVGGVCCAAAVGVLIWLQWFRKKISARHYKKDSYPSAPSPQAGEGYFSTPASFGTPSSTRYLLTRGPDDKFRLTPTHKSRFEPQPKPQSRAMSESPLSPIELPATPVSMSIWIEGAEVEEPRLAYVLPPRKIA